MRDLKLEQQVYFAEEPNNPYTVQSLGARYVVLTRPMTTKDALDFDYEGKIEGEVVYTIIDWQRGVRGPNNMVFNAYDYSCGFECDRCMNDLEDPDNWLQVSERESRTVPIRFVGQDLCVPVEYASDETLSGSAVVASWLIPIHPNDVKFVALTV